MPKEKDIEKAPESIIEGTAVEPPAEPLLPQEFVPPPPPQRPPPTTAQHEWLQAHPQYVRTAHAFGATRERGTLTEAGEFIPERPGNPVLEGGGNISVGIPLGRR